VPSFATDESLPAIQTLPSPSDDLQLLTGGALPEIEEAQPALADVEMPVAESLVDQEEPVSEVAQRPRADYSWLFGPTRGTKSVDKGDRT